MRDKKANTKYSDSLPGHISKEILQDLHTLLSKADDDGPKGRYLASECFSKYVGEDTAPADVRRRSAIDKWLRIEAKNAKTNERLLLAPTGLHKSAHIDADEVLDFGWITWGLLLCDLRRVIADVLGPLSYPLCVWDGQYTNGASTRVGRSPKAALDKLTGKAHCSTSAREHWFHATVSTVLEDQNIVTREESELFTVPKATDIDRVACKEPEINMFLQRSVGNHIRRRLKNVAKVDLNDQSINQALAQRAQKDGLATVDLSSASDSISSQLVFLLLPYDWWKLMDDIRVKATLIDDQVHVLNMFSSMGNGFTFELESLIFHAVTRVVCRRSGIKGSRSVYGDDIICPSSAVPRLKRVFDFLGFTMNPKKTNFKGPLRESCGKHYYNGVDISPFYVKEPIRRHSDLIRVLNRLLEWDGRGWGFITSDYVHEFHRKWRRSIPSVLWGGQNIDAIDALVSGHPPRMRIMRKRRKVEHERSAGLIAWHVQRRLVGYPDYQDTEFVYGPTRARKRFAHFKTALSTWLRDEESFQPTVIDPAFDGKSFLSDNPSWQVRTQWLPDLIFPDDPESGQLPK